MMSCTIYETPFPQFNVVHDLQNPRPPVQCCVQTKAVHPEVDIIFSNIVRGSGGVPTSFVQDCLSLRRSQVRAKTGIFHECAQGENDWGPDNCLQRYFPNVEITLHNKWTLLVGGAVAEFRKSQRREVLYGCQAFTASNKSNGWHKD